MTTQPHALDIRPATRDDIPFLAWCNYEASSPAPGFCYWDALLEGTNTPTMQFIEAVFRADALAWGRAEDFFIAEADGKSVAGASGFAPDARDYRPLRLERLPAVAASLGWTAEMLAQFQHGYERVWSDPLDTTLAPTAPWVIECVAVISEARGRGIARQLLRAILDEGKKRGFASAGISVTAGNAPAQRVYEALGFEMVITYGAAYFDGAFPGTIKYRLQLHPLAA
ncbi:MAG: GNAT family N-acetyltransferase [Anaerolineae bacterium]|nr:GNAT family N-acetyltransferase [Anaerolineae bacterium]